MQEKYEDIKLRFQQLTSKQQSDIIEQLGAKPARSKAERLNQVLELTTIEHLEEIINEI